ncbi:MAG TPA: phthalyl amidase [Pilimelia sp.]|nr:phthalyl amidase [Pilimelia sp.]
MSSPRIRTFLTGAVLILGLVAAPATALGGSVPTTACEAPVPSPTQPGYTIADPDCDLNGTPFVPLTDAAGQPLSRVHTGVHDGAAYRIEVPLNWNGDLVIFAHGYRGTGTTVWVDSPSLRAHHIGQGFAWAASSYQTNGYDVGQGVRDSHALIELFTATAGRRPGRVLMTGVSMGGHITAVAIEHFPRSFSGAMPYCGVLGDAELFDYFLDVNVTAAAFAGSPITFPMSPPPDYADEYAQLVRDQLPRLGSGWGTGSAPTLTPAGRRWAGVVQQRSGGTRPGFEEAFGFWNSQPSIAPLDTVPFLFGVYPGLSGGTIGIANGNVTSNLLTLYQIDSSPWLSAAEWWLNAKVLRVWRTAWPSLGLSGVPRVAGRPGVPVLSLHTIGDLFVPFSMEQVYARRALLHGRAGLFVSRAVRALGHCEFAPAELTAGFDDLVRWVRDGQRPAGDAVLDRAAVARPDFGCRFTAVQRSNFGAACPAP